MNRPITAAALVLGLAPAALAADLSLDRPLAGASLSSPEAAMSVYYVEAADDAVEVVATYAAHAAPERPARLVMALADGDDVTFALPARPGTLYRFARTGEVVSVTAVPADGRLALTR